MRSTMTVAAWGLLVGIIWAAEEPAHKAPEVENDRPRTYTYQGAAVSKKWMLERYEEFGGNLLSWKGNVVDAGKSRILHYLGATEELNLLPRPLCMRRTATIFQVIDDHSVLAKRVAIKRYNAELFHVDNIHTATLVDDATCGFFLTPNGVYRYSSVMGSTRSVPSFRLVSLVTWGEFVGAMHDGLVLFRYEADRRPGFTPKERDRMTHDEVVLPWKGKYVASRHYGWYRLRQTEIPAPRSPRSRLPPTPRDWTDTTGVFSVTATFVSMGAGQVKLRKEDGTEVALSMDKLSDGDQKWIRSRASREADAN